MPIYVMCMRFTPHGHRRALEAPKETFGNVREAVEVWEAKILHEFQTLGEFDHCTIFEAPDNFKAYRVSMEQEIADTAEIQILPAIDLPLFQRLMETEGGTEGPHTWQIKWWAKLARRCFRWHAVDRWVWQALKPLTITGHEHFKNIKGPCIVVANHTSHLDGLVLNYALPRKVRYNVYSGAAADRWFIKGRPELIMQPWYQSLVAGTFPIQRGGGSRALDYPKWLLEQGANLLIFPEGTRSTSRKMAKFKHGVSILALEKKVPVVPCYLYGLNKLRPKGSRELRPGGSGRHIQDLRDFEQGPPDLHGPRPITLREA
jgi:1-acyl-sn-glycerol-3-phosphate acyltransferase